MEKLYCKGGGCTAKLGAGILSHILERLPRQNFDKNSFYNRNLVKI